MKLRPYLPSFLALLMLLLVSCGSSQTNELTITLEAMQFSQNELQVQAGQPVTLHIVNKDGYAHSFDIDEFDIHLPLAAEENTAVTFTPDKSGSFTFYCGSPGHEAAGMAGSFLVTP